MADPAVWVGIERRPIYLGRVVVVWWFIWGVVRLARLLLDLSTPRTDASLSIATGCVGDDAGLDLPDHVVDAWDGVFAFTRTQPVQQGLQTEMWMFPVEPGVARADAMRFAPEPTAHSSPNPTDIASKGGDWVARWTKVVLK